MAQIVFLGTGGGRIVTALQKRYTGGVVINADRKILIDPGPGSLVRCLQFKQWPREIDVLCVSHQHTDHYTDAPAILEAMSEMTRRKKGVLIASKKLIDGDETDTPGISRFHQSLVDKTYSCGPGETIKLEGLTVTTTPTIHMEPSGIGFRFEELGLSYTGDTSCFDELIKAHKGMKRMIIDLINPDRQHLEGLMTVFDCIELLNGVKPKEAFITHFGMRALNEGPEKLAKEIEKETGVKVTAAKDGMIVNFDTKQAVL